MRFPENRAPAARSFEVRLLCCPELRNGRRSCETDNTPPKNAPARTSGTTGAGNIEYPSKMRIWTLVAALFVALAAMLLAVAPIPQDPAYHQFADERSFLGIPNFSNVASNAGFAIAALLGLVAILGRNRQAIFVKAGDIQPYSVFFIGVALVSIGSAFYHLEPTTERLLWDRLPMSIAFMAFSAAILADRVSARAGNSWLLALLVAIGVSSLLYWSWTESLGRGDLRLYGFVQFYPVITLPLILWMFPRYRYTAGRFLGWVVFWFVLSKIFEHFDRQIYDFLGGQLSGHTLKHLAAASSTLVVWRMLLACRDNPDRPRGSSEQAPPIGNHPGGGGISQ